MSSTNDDVGFSGEQLVDASTNAVETSVYDVDTISQLDETSPLIETTSHQVQTITGKLFTKSIQTVGKTSPLVKTSAQSMMTSVTIHGTTSPSISTTSAATSQPGNDHHQQADVNGHSNSDNKWPTWGDKYQCCSSNDFLGSNQGRHYSHDPHSAAGTR